MTRRTGEVLLARAIAGDRDALSALLERAAPALVRHLRGRIATTWQSVLDVDDVVQVTFLEAFLRIQQLVAADERAFLAWLSRIAENNLRDAVRGLECEKRPHPANRVQATTPDSVASLLDVLGVTTTTPSRGAAHREARELLEEALMQLPPDYASVIQLYDLQRLSAPEIANRLGKSRGNVHMLRSRGLSWLRDLLVSDSRFFSRG